MINQFNSYITKHKLVNSRDTILVATSGGIDSMVLIDLFIKANYQIAVAHLNHNLRGAASELDESFVIKYCKENNIPFHLKSLDVAKMVETEKINMHQLARRERYQFFEEICKLNEYSHIATAHHKDDKLEGFFINLIRGAGLKGLSGIKLKNRNIIRPLLFATKEDIKSYASSNDIKYREDSSNSKIKYKRNYIRHQIVPIIKERFPSYQETISNSIDHINDSHQLLDYLIEHHCQGLIIHDNNQIRINLAEIIKIPGCTSLLYEFVSPYGYLKQQVEDMIKAIDHTGARFYSQNYKALIDRGILILQKNELDKSHTAEYLLYKNGSISIDNIGDITTILDDNIGQIDNRNSVSLNAEKLSFPLKIRKWKAGDRFQPAGMNGQSKKIKKYLTDIKLNRFEKDNTYVLVNGEEICWIIGYRMDERYKGDGYRLNISKV